MSILLQIPRYRSLVFGAIILVCGRWMFMAAMTDPATGAIFRLRLNFGCRTKFPGLIA